jgi:hypothetical protein
MSIHLFHSRGQHSLSPVTWQTRLESALEEREVVGVVRDFVAQVTPPELRRLPDECRPGKFFDANDVTSFAFELARHHDHPDPDIAALIHKMTAFFSEASIRLSQLLAHSRSKTGESRHSA